VGNGNEAERKERRQRENGVQGELNLGGRLAFTALGDRRPSKRHYSSCLQLGSAHGRQDCKNHIR